MNEKNKAEPVLIVGGGIGGLSAALALSRKGIASHVIEQARRVQGDRRRHPARARTSSACSNFSA